jgi:hypothetical protein
LCVILVSNGVLLVYGHVCFLFLYFLYEKLNLHLVSHQYSTALL